MLPTNDITRRVLYNDGRFGVLWPVIFAEIVDSSTRMFNRGSVVWQHHTVGVVDFRSSYSILNQTRHLTLGLSLWLARARADECSAQRACTAGAVMQLYLLAGDNGVAELGD